MQILQWPALQTPTLMNTPMDKLALELIRIAQAGGEAEPGLLMAAAQKLNRQADLLGKNARHISKLQAKNATQAEHLRRLQVMRSVS